MWLEEFIYLIDLPTGSRFKSSSGTSSQFCDNVQRLIMLLRNPTLFKLHHQDGCNDRGLNQKVLFRMCEISSLILVQKEGIFEWKTSSFPIFFPSGATVQRGPESPLS
jgi:hypothetical protein